MITPSEIKKQCEKIWKRQLLQRNYISGESIFPCNIPFRKPSTKEISNNFSEVRFWIKTLKESSKQKKGYGYNISFRVINHRQLGQQNLPEKIFFSSQDDFLKFSGKVELFQKFSLCVDKIISREAKLKSWLETHTELVMTHANRWDHFLEICSYFQNNPYPNLYLRELNISHVGTKVIEQNRKILHSLLTHLLPTTHYRNSVHTLTHFGFERRYGLKYDESLVRFRILDEKLFINGTISDLSLPISQFNLLPFEGDRLFITENKINGLTFPPMKNSLVIFGLGYGVQSLKSINWLKSKKIWYWGDIDTHGFSILSQLRSYFPQTQSILMDSQTLLKFESLWVEEPSEKRCRSLLKNLHKKELQLYTELINNYYGASVRLEQERIGYHYARDIIRDCT